MAINLTTSWTVVRDTTLYRSNVHLICYAKIASQSTADNCSYVDTWLGIKIDGSWSYTTDSVKAHVSGAPDISWGKTTFSSGETKLASGQFRVDHESDGSARTWVTMWITQTYGGSTDSIDTEWLYLPSIPRASSPTLSSTNLIAGQSVTISTNRKSTAFTHKVSYSFGSSSGVISSNAGDSCSWTPSTSLLNQIPNNTSGAGTIAVETFNGSTKIGDTKSLSFTLSVPSDANPYIGTITLTEQHPGVKAKNANITVQQISRKLVSVPVTAKYSTGIKSVVCDGVTLTNNNGTYTGYVSNKSNGTYTVTVTDNRGLQSTGTVNQTYYAYSKPYFTASFKRESDTSQNGTLSASGTYSTILSNTVSMSIKRNDESSATSVTPTLSNGNISFSKAYTDLYYTLSFSIAVTVTDSFGESMSTTAYLGVGQYAFAMIKQGVVLGPDSYLFDKQNAIRSVLDFFYPVGSIYISTSSTFNPQNVWGGTWRKTADGRCLIGANSTYPLGSTGGEATHTLSTNEIPSHSHGLLGYIFNHANAQSTAKFGLVSSTEMVEKGWNGRGDNCDFDVLKNDNAVNSWSIRANGGGASHNNMQPYLAVYIWERTA